MAVYTTSISLKDAGFPLISRWAGRPSMVKGGDVPSLDAKAPTEGQVDYFYGVNKPQVIYCENVLPKLGGFASVGFVQIADWSGTAANPADIAKHVYTGRLRDSTVPKAGIPASALTDAVVAFGTTSYGSGLQSVVYALMPSGAVTGQVPTAHTPPVHIAALTPSDGMYFLLNNGTASNLYELTTPMEAATDTFIEQVLIGIAAADLNQCLFACAAGNYFILCKEDGTIFWNDPNNILDFTPSLITGAGSLIPTAIMGSVTGIFSWGDGFIIHTTAGSVVARYSNNAQRPWQFEAVPGSAAAITSVVANKLAATTQETAVIQYSWTTAGLQQTALLQGAQGLFADVGDFLASELLEHLTAGVPTLEYPPATSIVEQVDVMVARMGSRYLVISYGRRLTGAEYFTYALIYDLHLRRWGKVKIDHYEAVYIPATITGAETMRQIGFLCIDGTVKMTYEEASFEGVAVTHNATLIVGGISLVRGHIGQLNTVSINYGEDSPSVTVSALASADNINWEPPAVLPVTISGTGSATYGCRKVAKHHAISINGKFNISAFEVQLTKAGTR